MWNAFYCSVVFLYKISHISHIFFHAFSYIERPLIINGAKFDLRLYVYITCLDPLRIYFYRDGLVRFASVPYVFLPLAFFLSFFLLMSCEN